jgi:hypothetical protein
MTGGLRVDERVGMHADEQVGAQLARALHPRIQRHENRRRG